MPKPILDPCPLCRKQVPASFEHIPPESCDNDTATIAFTLGQVLAKPGGKPLILQRGHGYDSLCKECNSHLGKYNRAFSDWEEVCRAAKSLAGATVKGEFYPLRVLKGILGMFLSVHPELGQVERFLDYLRDPESQQWPAPLRMFAFSRQGNVLRSTGGFFLVGYGGEVFYMAEVHTSAMGYVLSLDGQCWSPSYTEITGFSTYGYDEKTWLQEFFWPLCVMTELPADYRNELMIAEGVSYRPVMVGASGFNSRAFNKREVT